MDISVSSFQEEVFLDQSSFDDHDDSFDRLPEEIVLSIFNKLHDAKSLCRSMSVCKRFRSIVPQVDEVFFTIPTKKTSKGSSSSSADQEPHKNSFKNLLIKSLIIKPLLFISQVIKFKPKNEDESDIQSFHVPNEVLKPFLEIRSLHLRLPCHGTARKNGSKQSGKKNINTFLKWKAEFGKELHSCVMLGAKAMTERNEVDQEKLMERGTSDRVIADDELKLRIVWTISCLIAASARHFLIQETVKQHKMIENVVISDESDQGMLAMDKEQIEELREGKGKDDEEGLVEYRSRVPALRMKMWYLQKLELPDSGKVMEGATLVVIRPAGGGDDVAKGRRSDEDLVAAAFGGDDKDGKVIGEAVRKLMVAKKCYTLEMNSF